jgi:tetratricopeptide (TPR) repeat protein
LKPQSAVTALAVTALLSACAQLPQRSPLDPAGPALELADTPFYPQEAYQCGPAALATVLGASQVAVSPEELTPQLYLPGRRGSLQAELIAATRRYQRVPYRLAPRWSAVEQALGEGRPVLVLQNLGLGWWPRWHYAVVIGVDPQTDRVLLRSGTEERLRMRARHFQHSWRGGDYWALVVAAPDDPPQGAEPQRWLEAVAPFETLGQPELALRAYTAAAERWPEAAPVWLALGNARYALADLPGAARALRHATRLAPGAAAYNNLAHVLAELGCGTAARIALGQAQRQADAPDWAEALAATAVRVEAAAAGHCDF